MKTHLRSRGLAIAVPLAMVIPSLGEATTTDGAASTLRACLVAAARGLDFSGVVSATDGGILATYARGVAAGPGSPPISIGSRFNLGSAGKMFTAVAVAQLIEAGRIRLDDPIGRYVSGLTNEAAKVTLRQLLDHSSGLGNYFDPENLPALMKARKLVDLLPLVAADKPAFPPGSRFSYSDTGYLLLGLMIERVSRQSYGDYLKIHIFEPAHMTQTGLDPKPSPGSVQGLTSMPADSPKLVGRIEGAPPAGQSNLGRVPRTPTPLGEGGIPAGGPLRPAPEAALQGGSAGGGFSTDGDIRKFFAALMQGKLVGAESLRMLVSPQIVAASASGDKPERDYGFGFGVGRYEGHRWFGHNGGAPGINTETAVFPDDRVTLVVLANRDPPAATLLFRRLRAALFDPLSARTCALRS